MQKLSLKKVPDILLSEIIEKKQLYFGLDELEVYLKNEDIFFLDKLVYQLDDDNTSSAYINIGGISFHYEKIKPNGYEYGFKFSFIKEIDEINRIIDFFAINYRKNEPTLVVYSQILTLYNLGKLDFDLYDFFNKSFNDKYFKLRRLDFAVDVSVPKSSLLRYFKKFTSKIALQSDGYYQTYYTREIQSDKNRLMTTRIYDKKKDSFKKDKAFLFPHLDNDFVNRIEVEIRKEYARKIGYSFKDILLNTNSVQVKLFKNHLNFDLKKKYQLPDSIIDKLTIDKKYFYLASTFMKLGFIPKRYMQQANGFAKRILSNTGEKGFIQYIIGVYFDDVNSIIRLPNGVIKYKTERNPNKLIKSFIDYLINDLHYSQSMINNLLKDYIKTPIIKLKSYD